ncbi:hypothetical protein CARUB_v10021520mg [Capsella rubella]|uniref:RING-type E3 ubiquitin transferase n=1 Tax=Capsella rubella TaxID=81985 RepID=R0HW34_9BRAS|nr:E3 ubiquitin-protein ligase SINA-like 2 [Capsella rubella]EOA34024.1 hypothetical protein CARUB_v10021520mg [Capsella rubella]
MVNPRRTARGDDVIARTGMLSDLDLLDCPICFHPLASPIYQCTNGHIICSTCRTKLTRDKCPSCTLPIGNNRSRITERLVGALFFPCKNSENGCRQKLSYGKDLDDHEKECDEYMCYCPVPFCDYVSFDKNLFNHFTVWHKDRYSSKFKTGQYVDVDVHVIPSYNRFINKIVLILQEYYNDPLVLLQSFNRKDGLCVTVNLLTCPSTPGSLKFGFDLIYRRGSEQITFESDELTRIQRVSFEEPVRNYMFIPYSALDERLVVKMELRIREVGYEEEEDDEEEDDE